MEHILQFAVDIDDKTIKERIENNAYDEVVERLVEELQDKMFQRGYFSSRYDGLNGDIQSKIINTVLDKYKDNIIEAAAKVVADKVMRSKPNRDKLIQAIIEEFNVRE